MSREGLFILILALSLPGFAQKFIKREPAFSSVPRELNEKAILACLPKLMGLISAQETSSMDNLKTRIERVYGLKRSIIYYRELVYKSSAGDKWRVEFYLTSDSLWGKEKYRLKFFKASDDGSYVEAPSPIKEEFLSKDASLKFAQYEDVESDERWEKFSMPMEPTLEYKSKDFKIFELTANAKTSKTRLFCNIAGGHPFCQCLK